MKQFFAVILLFLTVTALGATTGNQRTHILQIQSDLQKAEFADQFDTQPITFGLSEAQRSKIFDVSAGDVDLRNLFFVRVPATQAVAVMKLSSYLGEHPSFALPPHFGAPLGNSANLKKESADPDLLGQWWAGNYSMNEVWGLATGKGVTIADCDTGFYTGEADLKFNLLMDHSRDLSDLNNSRRVNDGKFLFHGTAVAALMAGVRDSKGTNGIAFNAKLVPLQYFNFDPALDDIDKEEATARCILHAIKIPSVRVIVVQNQTTSGSSETFTGTREAVKLALRAGINIVAAAGNSSLELKTEAQHDTGSIIVGALHENGNKAVFSNFGPRVTVSAFGEKLYTLYGPSGRMDSFGGTTAASAQVAATVALLLEINPNLTPDQVKCIVKDTADITSANRIVGGKLNILKAVEMALDTVGETAALQEQRAFRAKLLRVLARPKGL